MIIRKRVRKFTDEKTGEVVHEVIDKVLEVDQHTGKEVLKQRTRKEEKADGSAVVTEEKYEVDEAGQQMLVDHSRSVQASPTPVMQTWKGESRVEEGEEEVTVEDDQGKPVTVKAKVKTKTFADGRVRQILIDTIM